ncbi:MAG: hypothetical protein V7K60_00725 [Nostoc sp.]
MSALADIEAIATQKNLTLIRELAVPGGIVAVDAVIFRRVLDNLLSNAIKFSPSKSQVTLREWEWVGQLEESCQHNS